MKKILLILLIVLLVIILFTDVLLIPKGILALHLSQSEFISYDFNHFISKSDFDPQKISEVFTDLIFIDQMGSGYVFEDKKSQEVIIINSQQYTSYYKLWTIPLDY